MSQEKRDTIKMVADAKGTIIMSGAFGTAIIDADVAREIATMVGEHRGTVQRSEVLGRLVVAEKVREQPSAGEVPDVE